MSPAPYYQDDHVTIYHGDAFDLLPVVPAGSVHALIADPPYNGVVIDEWDNMWESPADFFAWTGEWIDAAKPALAGRASAAVFCYPDMACGVELEMRRRFTVLNHIVWKKPLGRLGAVDKTALRRFWPGSERIIFAEMAATPDGDLFRFVDRERHEAAATAYAPIRHRLVELRDAAGLKNKEVDEALGTAGMAGHYFGASQWSLPTEQAWEVIAGMMTDRGVRDVPTFDELRREFDGLRSEFDGLRREFGGDVTNLELLGDVWTFDPPPVSKRHGGHPTAKPEALIAHLIASTTREGDAVLDPFMGSGTALRVAKDLGRKAIGIELEERYCEAAANRCAQEVLPW